MTSDAKETDHSLADSGLGARLDQAPCGFVSFADDGTLRALNATLLDMLGYARAELEGRHVESIFTVGSRVFYQTHLFPLLRLHGRAEEIFLVLRAKDGTDVAVLANAVRRRREGEWVTESVVLRLVERRKFEDALLRAKKTAEEAQAISDEHRRRVEEANDKLERQAAELELIQLQLQEQAAELEAQSEELRVTNDELLDRSEELDRQRAIAENANRAKSEFLAMMSHELRTPLNAIGGYAQLLELGIHGPVTEAQTEALGRIARSQRHLLRLVNEVLNLARIEAGRVEYDAQVISLREVVDAVLPMIEPQLAERSLRFEVEVPAALAAYADWDKVQQILLNLLSNAAKFTPRDGVVRIDGVLAPEMGKVRLAVRDTGVGIAADRLQEIFEPFVQVHAAHTTRVEGTGLGLTISRNLARGIGGDLTGESHPGAGSTFCLTLPSAAR
ncbi:MAG: ATP-binding protein [Gemmatimonadota bacterium]|nr:ATP-binding protein [Gemmatimonadota bacterium]